MKKENKIIIVVVAVLLIAIISFGIIYFLNKDDKNNSNVDDNNQVKDVKETLTLVMDSKQKFIDEKNDEVYLKDYEIVENETAKVDKYVFIDLDEDGTEELVIYTTSDYGAYIILHCENNKIYGYKIDVRSFGNLKTDGSFIGASGAKNIEYLRINFDKNKYSFETLAVYNQNDKIYKIDGKEVSKSKIEEYAKTWDKKENVSWISK